MIVFKQMSWGNCFSYGEDNTINFKENPLVQLIGPNGAGKTSISLILQEVLYGKNNKNIKKTDIANNKSGVPGYWIKLWFNKYNDEYFIDLNRKSSLKLKLFKNGEDISGHTSLTTYKTIADIIGINDYKVFCQLIYQHSTDSLEFLTSTDMNRKKFLISLLQLDKYIEFHNIFKEKTRLINNEILKDKGAISSIESWINKHKDMDFTKKDLLEEIEIPETLYTEISKLKSNIQDINQINRKISTNNQYINELNSLNMKYVLNAAPAQPIPGPQDLRVEKDILRSECVAIQKTIDNLEDLGEECPACLQEIDPSIKEKMLILERGEKDSREYRISLIEEDLIKAVKLQNEILIYEKTKKEFERLNQLIDKNLPTKTLNLYEEKETLRKKEIELKLLEDERNSIISENKKITAHNTRITVIQNELRQMQEDLIEAELKLMEKENLSTVLELLKKSFGTNGLVSYKIESSVKELEKRINKYLAEISYFQMYFRLQGEKLNLEIVDDKNNVMSVANLSSGERARLNLATIVAIRSILSSLTNTKINLLFLDEIIGVLDSEGKEKFSEILLNEKLNTFFVSHDWSHPLVPTINIIKEHNISRIVND